MKKPLVKAGLLLLAALALPTTVQANAPEITPSLKKMLGGLPIAGIKDQVQGMVGALSKTSCGNNLTGCYMTQSGPLQLYFFTSGTSQQTLLLVVDKTLKMPKLLGEKAQKVMGDTLLTSPIISISTTDFELDNIKMPPPLQKVVRENYFNINTLSFSSGVQVAARANLGGPIKLTMQSMGVNTSQLTMRAAVVMPIPSDLAGGAGAGAGMADAVAHGDTMKKAGADALMPEAFVEFQFGPKSSIVLNSPKMVLTDATFFINNALTFGYKGNAAFKGAEGKKIIMHFQTPLNPAGAMDLLDFSFRMATPASFTMEDAAHMMVAMATPDGRLAQYGGGFIRNIDTFKGPLLAMTKPLSVVQLRNPEPPTPYVFGDSTKPFPNDDKYFNFVLFGPLADDGPLLKAAGDVRILGQKMGWLFASAGRSGLNGDVGEQITVKLGPLGKVSFKMQATMAINANKQDITLLGNFAGQKVEVGMSGSTMKVAVNASCVNPFEIKTQLEIQPSTDIAKVFDGQGGVNVDPSKISGCIGKELEAAYKKIAGEYNKLEGYTADLANAELKKISDAANLAAKQAEAAANKAAAEAQKAADDAKKAAEAAANKAAAETVKVAEKAAADAKDAADKATVAANQAAEKLTKTSGEAQKRADAVATEVSKYNTDQVKNWVSAGVNSAGDQITGGLKKVGGAVKKATCRLAGNCKKKKKDSQACIAVYDEEFFLRGHPGTSPEDAYWWWVKASACKNGDQRGSAEFEVNEFRNLNAARYGFPKRNLATNEELTAFWLSTGMKDGVQGSSLFNIQDYRTANSDIDGMNWASWMDYWNHWLNSGINEGRSINAEFNAKEYLRNYADLRELFGDTNYPAAFDHWVIQGKAEGRKGRTDHAAIAQAAADVQAVNDAKTAADKAAADAKVAAETAQKLVAIAQAFAGSVFDSDYYYDTAPDVVKANMDLATHWKQFGFNEGRQGSPEFSARFYLSLYPDLMQACGQRNWQCAVKHWLDHGIREGRQGSANFSVKSYLNRYPDLQNAFGKTNYEDALDHWLTAGQNEGRNGRP